MSNNKVDAIGFGAEEYIGVRSAQLKSQWQTSSIHHHNANQEKQGPEQYAGWFHRQLRETA